MLSIDFVNERCLLAKFDDNIKNTFMVPFYRQDSPAVKLQSHHEEIPYF